MFLFIGYFYLSRSDVQQFKYISCSYLSVQVQDSVMGFIYLNTSHVLIYRKYNKVFQIARKDLNTSHVLIYPNQTSASRLPLVFKYISCSYLSVTSMHWNSGFSEFKYISCSYLSSENFSSLVFALSFKYISCSYLSKVSGDAKVSGNAFKYISCSYLSFVIKNRPAPMSYLNTSHVLIYQQKFQR